jgi:hypothetical protein
MGSIQSYNNYIVILLLERAKTFRVSLRTATDLAATFLLLAELFVTHYSGTGPTQLREYN